MSATNLSLAESALQARLRDKLNAEAIQLWTEPFYDAVAKAVSDSEILALTSRYATELGLSEDEVSECLYSLQRKAIEKLAEREVFKSTGIATIRVKYSGFSTDNVKAGHVDRLPVNLTQLTGKDLKTQIAEQIKTDENRLKLICLGRVLKENLALDQQGLRNGTQLMVLAVAGDQDAFMQSEDQFRQLEETRGAADYLAGRENDGGYSLQVADQSGKTLDLPPLEKKALAVALALHEKGRASLKVNEFSKSLIFLLEADSVYNQCQSSILEMVDNFGLLNLDIAWCYLCLQSIAELPAVEARLAKCEKSLHRSYGENMERLIALKGTSGWEAALFVRLHLLQGVAAYHQGQIEKSKFYFSKVEAEMNRLKVSDDQLASLINMGYRTEESRMALRATYGNVPAAVDWIIRKREEKALNKKEEQEDIKRRKLQKRLGTTNNGQPVSVQLYRNLTEMGYHPALIQPALQQTNNDINAAIQLFADNTFISSIIERLKQTVPSAAGPSTSTDAAPTTDPVPGPSAEPTITPIPIPGLTESMQAVMDRIMAQEFHEEPINAEEMERSQKAYDALSKDIFHDESEYIDLALSAETQYLEQYKNLLQI